MVGIAVRSLADTDRFNEDARRAVGSWDDVRRDASDAFDRLVSLVATLSDEQLDADDGLIDFIIRVNGSEHYEEHPPSDLE